MHRHVTCQLPVRDSVKQVEPQERPSLIFSFVVCKILFDFSEDPL